MNLRSIQSLLAILVFAFLAFPSLAATDKPNFIIIFIDDLGFGDIEPFGSVLNETPHLNRMAAEGMKLTSFYSAAPVCTPSRAALLTGSYPKRVGLDFGSWRGVVFPRDKEGLNPDEITIAEILKEEGYATACFGKWHLGDQPEFLPTKQGFDEYFGIPYSNDMWPPHPPAQHWEVAVCPLPIIRQDEVVDTVDSMEEQGDLCRLFTEEAVSFIRRNQDNPFFVYLPHAFVHHPRYARPEFLEKAGIDLDGPLDNERLIGDHRGYLTAQRTRAQIEEVDWSVGQILDTLRELDLEDDTMVIFTSDNGGASGCVNTPLRGGKGSTWEGGMREPAIAWWPGSIREGSVCEEITTTMDLLPTIAQLAGSQAPSDRKIDGKDIAPLLFSEPGAKTPHEAFYYHWQTELRAVRSGPWKLHTSGELYNLEKDIGEGLDVAKRNPKVVERLNALLDDCRADLDNPANIRPAGFNPNPIHLLPPIE